MQDNPQQAPDRKFLALFWWEHPEQVLIALPDLVLINPCWVTWTNQCGEREEITQGNLTVSGLNPGAALSQSLDMVVVRKAGKEDKHSIWNTYHEQSLWELSKIVIMKRSW